MKYFISDFPLYFLFTTQSHKLRLKFEKCLINVVKLDTR